MTDYYWSKFGNYVIYPFEKVSRNISMREKHFNTAIFTILALMISEIPLIGGTRTNEMSEVTFSVTGTIMQLGTQPFVFASMAAPYIFDEPEDITKGKKKKKKKKKKLRDTSKDNYPLLLGLVLSWILSARWGYAIGWLAGIQLAIVAIGLMHCMVYLRYRGSISPTTSLIFANASKNILMSSYYTPIRFLWTGILCGLVAWIESLHVNIQLQHTKLRKHKVSIPLAVMYNSTSALVMYYTAVECLGAWFWPIRLLILQQWSLYLFITIPILFGSLWVINKKLPGMNSQRASDLVKAWKEQQLVIGGWRDPKRIHKHVQAIVDKNVMWNTIFLYILWTLAFIFRPSVGITTLFILLSTVKKQSITLKQIKNKLKK